MNDPRELARLLELQRDGQLNQVQMAVLRDYLLANPDAAAWWTRANAFDQRLAQAFQTRLDAGSLSPAARDRIAARLRSTPPLLPLRSIMPALLVLALVIFGSLSWARLQRGAAPSANYPATDAELSQPAPNADLAAPASALLLNCTPVPIDAPPPTPTPPGLEVESQSCVQQLPTPTPFSPAEIATATHWAELTLTALPGAPDLATSQAATATMAQILATDQAIRGPTDIAATATAEQAWFATMTAGVPTWEVATATAEQGLAQTATAFATLSPTSAAETHIAETAAQAVYALTATAVAGDPARATADTLSVTATALRATDYAQTATVAAATPAGVPTSTPTTWTPVAPTPCEQSTSPNTATPTATPTPTPMDGQAPPSACATPTPTTALRP
jgi:hypothetical protein